MKIKVESPQGRKLPALKPANPDKTNAQAVRASGSGEMPGSSPTSARNAQNQELDLMVLSLLEKAIAGPDRRQVCQEFEKESMPEPSVHSKEPIEAKEEPAPPSGPGYNPGFEAASPEKDTSPPEIPIDTPAETPIQAQTDEPEPEKMDSTVSEIKDNTITPTIVEHGSSGAETVALNDGKEVEDDVDEHPLFTALPSSSESGEKRSGGILFKKYAMAGGIAFLAILIGLAAYLFYGRSGSGENPGGMHMVEQQPSTGVQFSTAAPAQDGLSPVPAMPPMLQDQGENVSAATSSPDISKPSETIPSEPPPETPVQTAADKKARPAKAVPKTEPQQGREPRQIEQTAAKVTSKAPSTQNAAVAAKAESTANIRKSTSGNTGYTQREAGRPEAQAKSIPAAATGSGTSETKKITTGETTNETGSTTESAGNFMELQAGIAPTWDSIAALAPGNVAANFGNSANEIKSAPLKTEAPGLVKTEYTPPVLISKVNPSYPRIAAQLRKTGEVTLKLDVNEQGRVVHVEPIKGPDVFYDEAIRAALQWRYRPAARDGRNTESQVTVSINFDIK